ncbi:MAG: hypothetical protein AB8G99_14545 [Planctomycetaceae bacterium]
MRFQKSPPPAPFSGRDRIMVFLCLGALAVFFAVRVASKPEFWKALNKKPGQQEVVQTNDDPSLLQGNENFFGDVGGQTGLPDEAPVIEAKTDLSIPRDKLKPVRDNTMGIRAKELPSYYATLDFAQKVEARSLLQNAEAVPYTMLMAEPWGYRGRPVSIKGRLRRFMPIKPGRNPYGLQQLYDAWVFTEDSGSNPIHVVCSGAPMGLKPAEVYRNDPPEVALVGYFFKTQGYQSAGDGSTEVSLHTAPLVLAGTMNYLPVAKGETRDIASEMVPWLWWFAIGVAALTVMVLWNFAMSDWTFRQTRAHGLLQPQGTPNFEGVDALSTNEMLYELAQDSTAGVYSEPHLVGIDSFTDSSIGQY